MKKIKNVERNKKERTFERIDELCSGVLKQQKNTPNK